MKQRHNIFEIFKTVSKQFRNCFTCFSHFHCRCTLFARQARGGTGRWRMRNVDVVSAAW